MTSQRSKPQPASRAGSQSTLAGKRYILFNKPYLVLTSFTGEEGQVTLKGFIPFPDVYAAGRLDYRSEGLVFLTNDGILAHQVTSPEFEHPKTYLVQVEGVITQEAIEKLRLGVEFQGQQTKPAAADSIPEPDLPARPVPVRDYHPTSWLQIVLREGKKHQVRHMTAAVGFPTLRLVRTAIGPLSLEGLSPGEWRELASEELAQLQASLNNIAASMPRKKSHANNRTTHSDRPRGSVPKRAEKTARRRSPR